MSTPPRKGYQIRASALAEELSRRHDIRLVPLRNKTVVGGIVSAWSDRFWANVLRVIARAWPIQSGLFDDPLTADYLSRSLTRSGVDVAVCFTERMPFTTLSLAERIPTILDVVDAQEGSSRMRSVSGSAFARPFWSYEARAFRRLAREYENQVAGVVVSAQREQSFYPGAAVIRNGSSLPRLKIGAPSFDVVFSGNLAYFPNRQALREICLRIVPLVNALRPQTKFLVVGRGADHRSRSLCAAARVTLHEDVQNLAAELRSARVAIAPLRSATGSQLKAFDALAVGLPLLAYEPVAGGLDGLPGVLVCRDAQDLALRSVSLLSGQVAPQLPALSEVDWQDPAHKLGSLLDSVRRI